MSSQQHRQALKHTALNPKETFREHCAQRVRQRKKQLVQQLREQGQNVDEPETIDKLNAMLSMEFDTILQQECQLFNVPLSQLDDLKIQMMQEIETEWHNEEAAELKLYEETQQYEDAMFAAAIQEYLGDAQVNIDAMEEGKTKTQTSTIVTCPLCHTHKLLQTKHAILCKCGLKIRTNTDGISLEFVQTHMQELLAQHAQQCTMIPVLSQAMDEKLYGTRDKFLTMSCAHCGLFEIVL